MFDKALEIAIRAHRGQKDRGGYPYILHPLRIALGLKTSDEELLSIAVLHDVVEDSEITVDDLMEAGFTNRVVTAVAVLTRPSHKPYEMYVQEIAQNKDATRVKLGDLEDNSDINRLKGLTKKDFKRIEKYHKAHVFLKNVL